MSVSTQDLKVEQIEMHAFTENDRAVVVLGTGATRQVFLFIGPSDSEGFVAFCTEEVNEFALDGYIDGLLTVWRIGSALGQARSVTAEGGGTMFGTELGMCLSIEVRQEEYFRWYPEPISAIYFQSSKE